MKTIASFTIDHLRLLPDIYVSCVDSVGSEVITTFDLRLTRPNHEPVMNTAEVHTIEHLAASVACGNYLDMNLPMANYLADRYLKEVLYDITEERLKYPQ